MVMGLVLSGIGASMGALRSLGSSNTPTEMETVEFSGQSIDRIEISLTTDELEILPSQSGYVTITYPIGENPRYKYQLEKHPGDNDNTLLFYSSGSASSSRNTMFGISLTDWRPGTVRVYVPSGCTIQAETISGKITLESITAASLELSSTSGEIEASEVTTMAPGSFDLSTVSGSVDIEDCRINGSLSANTTSGQVEIENAAIYGGIDIDTISGIVRLALPREPNHLKPEVTTVSGHVEIQPFPVYQGDLIRINTTSGDVSIYLAS